MPPLVMNPAPSSPASSHPPTIATTSDWMVRRLGKASVFKRVLGRVPAVGLLGNRQNVGVRRSRRARTPVRRASARRRRFRSSRWAKIASGDMPLFGSSMTVKVVAGPTPRRRLPRGRSITACRWSVFAGYLAADEYRNREPVGPVDHDRVCRLDRAGVAPRAVAEQHQPEAVAPPVDRRRDLDGHRHGTRMVSTVASSSRCGPDGSREARRPAWRCRAASSPSRRQDRGPPCSCDPATRHAARRPFGVERSAPDGRGCRSAPAPARGWRSRMAAR